MQPVLQRPASRRSNIVRRALYSSLPALLLLLAGCLSAPDPAAGPPSVDRAERMIQQNKPAAAAQIFEQLAATNPPPKGPDFALAAARAWLIAGQPDDASRAIALAGETLTASQRFERSLLQIQVQGARGQYANAWRQASAIPEPRDPAQAAQLFHLQQQMALRAGQPVEAVRAGMARERVAASDADRNVARRDLLNDLRAAIEGGLRVDPAASREPLVRGWLELGQIAADADRNPQGAANAVRTWQGRYPAHPAATVAMAGIVAPAPGQPSAGTGPQRVASGPMGLLLPLTGRTSLAASLVRDGFIAGLDAVPESQRPEVRIYDTGTLGVDGALQKARADGMAILVGPLTRDEVLSAAQLHGGGAPLLLLNSLGEQGAPRGVYQFALAPEDEARQIARAAWAAGQHRALVLAQTGDWGTRVSTAFHDEFTRAGGDVVAQAKFDPAIRELTDVITQALKVNDSRARHRRVQQVVGGELLFEAQPRDDIDLIFSAAQQPLTMRQIQPQLRFFGAGGLPSYMTSDSFDPDPLAARDLEGIRFPEMPWVLDTSGPAADRRAATQPIWADRGQRLSRLFAFGHDAATLALVVGVRTPVNPVQGLTGKLAIDADGRVQRELEWAKISGGIAQPVTSLVP
jgi:outer membrane PBP1 activator LpoA protein